MKSLLKTIQEKLIITKDTKDKNPIMTIKDIIEKYNIKEKEIKNSEGLYIYESTYQVENEFFKMFDNISDNERKKIADLLLNYLVKLPRCEYRDTQHLNFITSYLGADGCILVMCVSGKTHTEFYIKVYNNINGHHEIHFYSSSLYYKLNKEKTFEYYLSNIFDYIASGKLNEDYNK